MFEIDFFMFVVYSFAVWRLSSLLVNENGPFLIFLRIRMLLGTSYIIYDSVVKVKRSGSASEVASDSGIYKLIEIEHRTELAKLLSCIWCTSIWVSIALVLCLNLMSYEQLSYFNDFCFILALSTFAIKIDGIG